MKYVKEHIVECTKDGIVETLADKTVWVQAGAATTGGALTGAVGGAGGMIVNGVKGGVGTILGHGANNIYHECFTPKGIAKKVIKDTIHKIV